VERHFLSLRSVCLAGTVLLSLVGRIHAQSGTLDTAGLPDEGRYLNKVLPDILVQSEQTPNFRLSDFWRDKPVLVTMVFARCAGICSPFLSSLKSAADSVGGAGRDYRVVVLSFDPQDTAADMAVLAKHVGIQNDDGWVFATSHPAEIRWVADAMGFWFRWDEDRHQFDHPAMLVGVRNGQILRLLIGGTVSPARLREVLDELRGGFVKAYPLPGRVIFRCFQYDPATQRYRPDWGFLLLFLPASVAVFATRWVFRTARR
jgi:protein SCO1/2